MRITKSRRNSGNVRIDRFNEQMQDFKNCPECRRVISRATDVKILTWDDETFSPFSVKEVLQQQAEWPIKIIAKCPLCGCEWESDEI